MQRNQRGDHGSQRSNLEFVHDAIVLAGATPLSAAWRGLLSEVPLLRVFRLEVPALQALTSRSQRARALALAARALCGSSVGPQCVRGRVPWWAVWCLLCCQYELHEGLCDRQRQELHLLAGEPRKVGHLVFARAQGPLDRSGEMFRNKDDALLGRHARWRQDSSDPRPLRGHLDWAAVRPVPRREGWNVFAVSVSKR